MLKHTDTHREFITIVYTFEEGHSSEFFVGSFIKRAMMKLFTGNPHRIYVSLILIVISHFKLSTWNEEYALYTKF